MTYEKQHQRKYFVPDDDKLNSRTELLKTLLLNKATDKRTSGFTSTGFKW